MILPATLLFAAPRGAWRGRGLARAAVAARPRADTRVPRSDGTTCAPARRWPLHVEYAGLIPQVEQLAARFGDDDLLIVEARDAQSDVHVIATPLAYIYARNVLLLNSRDPTRRSSRRSSSGRGPAMSACSSSAAAAPICSRTATASSAISSDRFQVPEYQSALNAYPRGCRRRNSNTASTSSPPPSADERDRLVRSRCRHERRSARPALSCQGTGRRPHVPVDAARPRTYPSRRSSPAQRANSRWCSSDGGRPPAAPPARVDVFLHNQQLGTVASTGFHALHAADSARPRRPRGGGDDPVELRLVTTTWNPSRVLGTRRRPRRLASWSIA